MVPAGGPGAPTSRIAGTGGVGSGGALGQVLGGRLFKKVHFPVAMAMIKCAKNTYDRNCMVGN